MKAKDILITLGAAGIIGAGVYKYQEFTSELVVEIMKVINSKANKEEVILEPQVNDNGVFINNLKWDNPPMVEGKDLYSNNEE